MANLTELKVLALTGSLLSGPMPTWIGELSQLETLLPEVRYRCPTPRFLFRPGQGPEDVFPKLGDTYGPNAKPVPRPARLSHELRS